MKYIIFAALFQTLITLLLLLSNRKKQESDSLLVALLGGIGWHLLTKFYIFTALANPSVSTTMHTFIQLSYGPLLYLYAEKKRHQQLAVMKQWYLFIPLIMSVALYCSVIIAYCWYPAMGKFTLDIYNMMVGTPIIGSHLIFGLLIIYRNRHREHTEHLLIRNLSLLLIAIGLAEIALTFTVNSAPQYTLLNRSIIYILLGAMPVLVIRHKFLSAMSEWQQNLKQQLSDTQAPQLAFEMSAAMEVPVDNPGRRFLLEPAQHVEVFQKIELLIKDHQRYKEEDISLEKLAAISGISRHYISETLNVFAKKSFYQYVNECRIEEVIRLLNASGSDESLLAIAYKSGFKNKSSFNAYFKKIVGSTPSDYLRTRSPNPGSAEIL